MQAMFEFLFKYRLLLFQEGDFAFGSPWPTMVVLGLVAALSIPTVLTYAAARGDTRPVDRAIMAALRLGVIALLVFILFQPILVLTTVVPQRNFVGILIDDSQSMQITDANGVPRSDFIRRTFGAEGSELLAELNDKFALRFFRFSRGSSRLGDVSELTYQGTSTQLGRAMVRAQEELAGVPLSGLVVISDGADNSGETESPWWHASASRPPRVGRASSSSGYRFRPASAWLETMSVRSWWTSWTSRRRSSTSRVSLGGR